jgi:hypothetical protein
VLWYIPARWPKRCSYSPGVKHVRARAAARAGLFRGTSTLRSLTQAFALFVVVAATGCGASAPSESQSDELPADVRINLERDYDVTLHGEPWARARVDANGAIRAASGFRFGSEGSASAYLVRYSDPNDCEYASELDAGQPETAQCTPLTVNRLAWLVVFRDVQAPIFGPPGRRGPDTYDATVAAFVDARSGRELSAVTLPAG